MDGLILSMLAAFAIMGALWLLGGLVVLLFQLFGWVTILLVGVFIAITIVVYLTLDS